MASSEIGFFCWGVFGKIGFMEMESLTIVQRAIAEAVEAFGGRARFSEADIAKKVRAAAGISGKKRAGISLFDLEAALSAVPAGEGLFWAVSVSSANVILVERSPAEKEIGADVRKRRVASEKSSELLVNSDFSAGGKKKIGRKDAVKARKSARTERKSLNIYSDFDDFE